MIKRWFIASQRRFDGTESNKIFCVNKLSYVQIFSNHSTFEEAMQYLTIHSVLE